jgi:hypothetical protein
MIRKKLFVFAVSFLWIGASAPPSAIQKKLEKLIHANFAVLNYDLKPVEVFTDIADQLPRSFNIDNFMSVDSEGKRIGFVYTGRGPSKTDVYDFAILFDSKLIIKSVKILQYREDYGGEIASKRWLKQFIGNDISAEFVIGENVAAISGATISVRSMTIMVNQVLSAVNLLLNDNVL